MQSNSSCLCCVDRCKLEASYNRYREVVKRTKFFVLKFWKWLAHDSGQPVSSMQTRLSFICFSRILRNRENYEMIGYGYIQNDFQSSLIWVDHHMTGVPQQPGTREIDNKRCKIKETYCEAHLPKNCPLKTSLKKNSFESDCFNVLPMTIVDVEVVPSGRDMTPPRVKTPPQSPQYLASGDSF